MELASSLVCKEGLQFWGFSYAKGPVPLHISPLYHVQTSTSVNSYLLVLGPGQWSHVPRPPHLNIPKRGREILPPCRCSSSHPIFIKWHLFSLTVLSRRRWSLSSFWRGRGKKKHSFWQNYSLLFGVPVSPVAGDACQGPPSGKDLEECGGFGS